jgi:hypothetical protein
MKVLADKHLAAEEARGRVWTGNRRQFYAWWVRLMRESWELAMKVRIAEAMYRKPDA